MNAETERILWKCFLQIMPAVFQAITESVKNAFTETERISEMEIKIETLTHSHHSSNIRKEYFCSFVRSEISKKVIKFCGWSYLKERIFL